jgi:hypothetical protein
MAQKMSQGRWYTSVIPAWQEMKIGRSQSKAGLSEKHETLYEK